MNVGMAEPEWNNNEVGREEEDLSKGTKEGSSLSISLGNVFVSSQVPLLMPQYQLVLCKRINPFDSWLGKGTKTGNVPHYKRHLQSVRQSDPSPFPAECLDEMPSSPSSNWRPILRLAFRRQRRQI